VEAELDALPSSLRARIGRIVHKIQAVGLENMGEPDVKHLEGKLWEIRAKGADGIARALYVTVKGRRVVIVLVFQKKTDKTPSRVLETARDRMRKVVEKVEDEEKDEKGK